MKKMSKMTSHSLNDQCEDISQFNTTKPFYELFIVGYNEDQIHNPSIHYELFAVPITTRLHKPIIEAYLKHRRSNYFIKSD